MGSGELAPALTSVHRQGIAAAGADRVVIIDSPFGFQENAALLTEKIRSFFEVSCRVPADVASYRHPSEGLGARDRMRHRVGAARYVFAGPGSPSYALARWAEVDLAPFLHRVLAGGGTVTFASAAACTVGALTLPVYEIYKVGADPHWLPGLDLTGPFGFSCVVVPHWNNREGGDHDTSHCYVGERRFRTLASQLEIGVIGVDEHTAAIIDFGEGRLRVAGVGGVELSGVGRARLEPGESLELATLAELVGRHPPEPAREPQSAPEVTAAIESADPDSLLEALLDVAHRPGPDGHRALHAALVEVVEAAREGLVEGRRRVEQLVEGFLDIRARARARGDYDLADSIRDHLRDAGIELHDRPSGTDWEIKR